MSMSKRTLYKVYKTKDNLINACLEAYIIRIENRFQIMKDSHPAPLTLVGEVSKAFVQALYKGERAFWVDITDGYRHIYDAICRIWSKELERNLFTCQAESVSR